MSIRAAPARLLLQVLFDEELAKIAHSQVELSREQLTLKTAFFENGKASEAEVYDARSRVAVSYTHLDVYKRQVLLLTKLVKFVALNCIIYVLLPVRRLEFKKKELTRKTYYPYIKKAVSYTHLDVYKRQALHFLC